MRKGASPIISSVIYIGLAAGTIATIFGVTQPLLDQMAEANNIQQMLGELPQVQEQILSVSELREGSQEQIAITFRGGNLQFRKSSNSIEYQIETGTEIITPGTSRQIGNVRISSGADVDVTNTTVDGTDCWRMENSHTSVCIRTVPEGTTEQLQAYWTLDAGSGQEVNDSSLNDNDGTLGSSDSEADDDPAWTDDCRAGSCLDFDGTDDYVEVPDVIGGNEEISVSAWVNPDGFDGENPAVVGQWDAQDPQELVLRYSADSDAWEAAIQDTEGNTISTSGGDPVELEWTHLAATYDSDGALRLYVNGNEVSSVDVQGNAINDGGSWLGIGHDNDGTTYFDGTIDEVAVYDHAMGATEAQARYRGGVFDRDFLQTEDLLVRYENLDSGFTLGNPSVRPFINGNATTDHGFGYTEVDETGEGIPSGEVTAHVQSLIGIDYALTFQLTSGADFLETRVAED